MKVSVNGRVVFEELMMCQAEPALGKGLRHRWTRSPSISSASLLKTYSWLRLLAFVALAIFWGRTSSYAESFKFDPASCKNQTGNFYVALGRSVFAMPGDEMANVVIDPTEQLKFLKPPDSNDPIGCFGNPLQSDSYAMLYSMAFGADIPGQRKLLVPELLTLFNLDRGAFSKEDWPGEQVQQEIAERSCKSATIREDLANGLVACRIKPVFPPNARQEDWAAAYIAKSDIYTTPLGKPFVINCSGGMQSDPIGDCNVAYALSKGVGVSYRFKPHFGSNPIAIDLSINFDKSLRAFIERALVKNYPWPD